MRAHLLLLKQVDNLLFCADVEVPNAVHLSSEACNDKSLVSKPKAVDLHLQCTGWSARTSAWSLPNASSWSALARTSSRREHGTHPCRVSWLVAWIIGALNL